MRFLRKVMNTGKYVFSQLLEYVDKYEFDKCIKRYFGNHRVRKLNCWNQFVQLLFGQITTLDSLRSIHICLQAHEHQLYHLGIRQFTDRTSLLRANERRDWRIFADFGNYLMKLVRPMYAKTQIPNIAIDNEIFALDSTSIACSINLMSWAEGKYERGAVKMHTIIDLRGNIPTFIHITDGKYHDSNVLDEIIFSSDAIYLIDKAYIDFKALFKMQNIGAFFVTRAKKTMHYEIVEENFNIDQTTGLRSDKTVELTVAKSKKLYPEKLRLVEFYDEINEELLVFLTNNFIVSALEVARLYQNRWQIEIFFKWIKQNLTIKKFWGYSQNAVKTHIWIAIIAYLLVAYVKVGIKSDYSTYEIMQILSVSAFDKTPIRELLIKQQKYNQNSNEQLVLFE